MKLLLVLQKQFQPSFNKCCGRRKKRKLRKSKILHRINNSQRKSEDTNDEASFSLMF